LGEATVAQLATTVKLQLRNPQQFLGQIKRASKALNRVADGVACRWSCVRRPSRGGALIVASQSALDIGGCSRLRSDAATKCIISRGPLFGRDASGQCEGA
jgi:hypothetical protein